MKIFDTSTLDEKVMKTLSADEAAHIYNGLDCCVTAEIFNTLKDEIYTHEPPNVAETYETALAKLAPIMEMSLRGTKIDERARQETIHELEGLLTGLDAKFQRLMTGAFDITVNWRSPVQLKNLFYGIFRLKEIKKRNARGQFAPTVNGEALEKFKMYRHAALPATMILAMRDLHKKLGFLKTQIDPDGRMRTRYNIAGTNTGRLASSMSDFGTGTNLQNVDRSLRYPFVADDGYYLFNIDLEQADARNVGAIQWDIFRDMTRDELTILNNVKGRNGRLEEWSGPVGEELAGHYLDICESEDLHTFVCHATWPDLDWPEDKSEWKSFCDSVILHGQDSYRQGSKKLGHGTNYYGTPRTMARHAHTPVRVIEHFQSGYFKEFPAMPLWHKWTIRQIETTGTLTTLFGRRRMFFGRGRDASTHRKAIAYSPQSMTGEEIDRGMLQIWRAFPEVQLLNQVHDSVLLQLPFEAAEELIPKILKTMEVHLALKGGRDFVVPLDAAGGWNWGYADPKKHKNMNGLMKWKGSEQRVPPVRAKRKLKDYL